jgi:valyl-tRNA synthetase
MDEGLSGAWSSKFSWLYKRSHLARMAHWELNRAVSVDLEVEHQQKGKLWHIKYPIRAASGFIIVATTGPVTMLGDVAVR